MPANGMLVLFTCQGDTAEYRRLQVRLCCTVESCAYVAFAISDHVYITLRHKCIVADVLQPVYVTQESKYRQQAGLDDLPPWTIAKEAELAKTASRVCRALCFATVKQ